MSATRGMFTQSSQFSTHLPFSPRRSLRPSHLSDPSRFFLLTFPFLTLPPIYLPVVFPKPAISLLPPLRRWRPHKLHSWNPNLIWSSSVCALARSPADHPLIVAVSAFAFHQRLRPICRSKHCKVLSSFFFSHPVFGSFSSVVTYRPRQFALLRHYIFTVFLITSSWYTKLCWGFIILPGLKFSSK